MKKFLFFISLSAVVLADIKVMIPKLNSSFMVTKEEIADLYLGKTKTIRGIEIIPIDNADKQSYQEFYRKIVNKTPKQIHAYWVREMYRGNKIPPQRLSNHQIEEAFRSKRNIIAYSLNALSGQVVMSVE